MLQAKDIVYRAGKKNILKNISLEILPGKITAIIGPNGAGKSTLLRILSGELLPSSGTVLINGTPIKEIDSKSLANLRAVLPQSNVLDFAFSVFEVVLMGRLVSQNNDREDNEAIQAVLEMVQITELKNCNYQTLSGGEKQKVHIARVLSQLRMDHGNSHRYLLLDEPTLNLDLRHQYRLLQLAKNLLKDDIGVLAILHDLNMVAQFADSVGILNNGELTSFGDTRSILSESNIKDYFGVNTMFIDSPKSGERLLVALGA